MPREIACYLRLWVAVLCLIPSLNAHADVYPSRTVTIVVPIGPGGAGVLTARIVAQKLTELTKASVIIPNRPGAGSASFATVEAHGEADGYTSLLLGDGTTIATQLFKNLPYTTEDLKQVPPVSFFDLALVASSNSPFECIADPLAYAMRLIHGMASACHATRPT